MGNINNQNAAGTDTRQSGIADTSTRATDVQATDARKSVDPAASYENPDNGTHPAAETGRENALSDRDEDVRDERAQITGTNDAGNRNTGKRIAAVLAMIAAVFVCVVFMNFYLSIPNNFDDNRVIALHHEPENSIDVLLIGSSATYSGFSSAYAYEEYGFTSYPYAIGGATCTIWKPALRDALRTQNPKLIVVDVFGGGYDGELIRTRSNQIYTIMSHYPLSKEKLEMADEICKTVDGTSKSSLLFPFLKYHMSVASNIRFLGSRLQAERTHTPSPLKGIETHTRTRKLAKVDPLSFTDETEELDPAAETVIRDFMGFCREKDLRVLFVKYPTVLTEEDPDELLVNRRANRILEIAGEYGFDTFNMQKDFHEIGMIERKDYYNHGHTNTRGQRKVTRFLGRYIQQQMGIGPSRLDESAKADWDQSVEVYHRFEEMSEKMIVEDRRENIGESPGLARQLTR